MEIRITIHGDVAERERCGYLSPMNSRANPERGTLCPRSRLIPDVYQDSGPESLRDPEIRNICS